MASVDHAKRDKRSGGAECEYDAPETQEILQDLSFRTEQRRAGGNGALSRQGYENAVIPADKYVQSTPEHQRLAARMI